jgi:hypothetical protein
MWCQAPENQASQFSQAAYWAHYIYQIPLVLGPVFAPPMRRTGRIEGAKLEPSTVDLVPGTIYTEPSIYSLLYKKLNFFLWIWFLEPFPHWACPPSAYEAHILPHSNSA